MHIHSAAAALMLVATMPTASAEMLPHTQIAPGMTITEVQALIGPPHTIKSLRWREVLLYCPSSWLGISFGQRIYTTVWLANRRVIASRTLIEPNFTSCEDFITAFQWTDPPPASTAQRRSD